MCVIRCMIHALDVGPDVMWCTSDQLRLEGEPIDGDLWCIGVLVILLHHHMCRTKPSDLDQIRLSCITPEPDTLSQTLFGIGSLVLHLESSSKAAITIGVQQCLSLKEALPPKCEGCTASDRRSPARLG